MLVPIKITTSMREHLKQPPLAGVVADHQGAYVELEVLGTRYVVTPTSTGIQVRTPDGQLLYIHPLASNLIDIEGH